MNGNWGSWGPFGDCNKCKRIRKRLCNQPSPSSGGSECIVGGNRHVKRLIQYDETKCASNACGKLPTFTSNIFNTIVSILQ